MLHIKKEPFSDFARSHIEQKQLEPLKHRLHEMSSAEITAELQELSAQDRAVSFRLLSKRTAVEVFDFMDVGSQRELLEAFTEDEALQLFETLEPKDRVQLLDELPAVVARQFLSQLSCDQREITQWLMGYRDGTVGRIMSAEFVDTKALMTTAEALDRIRWLLSERQHVFHSVYVTDGTRRLIGVLPLSAVVTAPPETRICDLLDGDRPTAVGTDEDQERAAHLLQQVDAVALPVVDSENRLVGVFVADEAMDVLREEVTDDMYDKVGLLDLTRRETDRSARLIHGSFWHWLAVRVPFLLITLAGGMAAGVVIDQFEEVLAAVVATAIFIPVIMDMGGNVGTQSSTIFTRAMVLGQINMRRFLLHWGRESLYGFGMATLLGLIGGSVAHLWQGIPGLGLAVGLSLTLTVTIGCALGFLVPFLLIKLGFDQAAGADPIITTIKDMSGLAIYFSSVSLLVPLIAAG